MAILIFVLGVILLAAGRAGGYMSLDLLPTAPGLVYALAGAVAVVGALIVFALGALAVRVGALARAVRAQTGAATPAPASPFDAAPAEPALRAPRTGPDLAAEPEVEMAEAPPLAEGANAEAFEAEPEAEEGGAAAEAPINENRAGRLPTLAEIEQAIETPEPPPTLIGRYSSGGANYMIFSDGSIEAETDEGASFKFASMGDFKQFLKQRADNKPGA